MLPAIRLTCLCVVAIGVLSALGTAHARSRHDEEPSVTEAVLRPREGQARVAAQVLPEAGNAAPRALRQGPLQLADFVSLLPASVTTSAEVRDSFVTLEEPTGAKLVDYEVGPRDNPRWISGEVSDISSQTRTLVLRLRAGVQEHRLEIPVVTVSRNLDQNRHAYRFRYSPWFSRAPSPRSSSVESMSLVFSGQPSTTYVSWEVNAVEALPRSGDYELLCSMGQVAGFHVSPGPHGEKSLTVRAHISRSSRHDHDQLALELRRGGTYVSRVLFQVPTAYSNVGRRTFEKLRRDFELAHLGLKDAVAAEGVWTTSATRSTGEGFFMSTLGLPGLHLPTEHVVVGRPDRPTVGMVAGTLDVEGGKTRVTLVGRYWEPGPVTLDVSIFALGGTDTGPIKLPKLVIDLPAAREDPRARQAWSLNFSRMVAAKQAFAPSTPFFSYARQILARRAGPLGEGQSGSEAPTRPGRDVDLMSAFTGLAAVQEALQLDALGAAADGAQGAKPSVPLSSLTAPTVASHPFDRMMAGRLSVGLAMDALAPEDCIYAHARSIDTVFEILDQAEAWGQDLVSMFESRSGDRELRHRYLRRLLVEPTTLSRMLAGQVMSDVGLIAEDPFVREGTDLALLFHQTQPTMFDAALAPQRLAAVAQGAVLTSTTYAGAAIRSWATTDATVGVHEATLGEYRVLATSERLLRAVIDCHGGGASMARAADHRYMRVIFPSNAPSEDAFMFLSDAFVRKMVGPRIKLGAARRLTCAVELTRLESARRMFHLENRQDADVPLLVERGYLTRPPRCPDGGSMRLIGTEAQCSLHNRIRQLAPIMSIPLELATEQEAKDYRTFVFQYKQYWRQFMDPVGVRVSLGSKLSVETVILPLVENSVYTGLKNTLAIAPRELRMWGAAPGSPLSIGLSLPTTGLRGSDVESLAPWLPESEMPGNWLGTDASVTVHDAAPLFTLDFSAGSWLSRDLLRSARPSNLGGLLYLSSFDLPLVLSVPVQSEKAATGFFEKAVRHGVQYSREGMGFRSGFERVLDPYIIREGFAAPVLALPVQFFVIQLHYFVSIHKGRVWISNQLSALQASMTAPEPPPAPMEHVALTFRPTQGKLMEPHRLLSLAERQRRACLANHAGLWVLYGLERLGDSEVLARAPGLMGYRPECPDGGSYRYDSTTDEVSCSQHGSAEAPRQPAAPAANSAASRALSRLESFSIGMTFTPDGLSTRIEVQRAPTK